MAAAGRPTRCSREVPRCSWRERTGVLGGSVHGLDRPGPFNTILGAGATICELAQWSGAHRQTVLRHLVRAVTGSTAFHEDESAALFGDRRPGSTAAQPAVDANDH